MYAWLLRLLPPPLAQCAIAFWYLLLILLIGACAALPAAEFRYLNL